MKIVYPDEFSNIKVPETHEHRERKLIEEYLTGEYKVIEGGSGFGVTAVTAAKLGCKVETYDISQGNLALVDLISAENGVGELITAKLGAIVSSDFVNKDKCLSIRSDGMYKIWSKITVAKNETINIPLYTLKDITPKDGKLALILDIEGIEYEIFNNNQDFQLICERYDLVIAELHHCPSHISPSCVYLFDPLFRNFFVEKGIVVMEK